MNGLARAWLAAFSVLAACSNNGSEISVTLRTDYVPQVEFDEVRVFLAMDGGREEVLSQSARSLDYVQGQRIVTFEDIVPGDYRLRAQLHRGNVIVGSRSVGFSPTQDTNATLIVTRSCEGVMCPGADPMATECSGGRCVLPACSPEAPAACGEGCVVDGDCVATAACAEGRCTTEGSCVFTGAAGACGDSEYCDAQVGCLPRCANGSCGDAGVLDARPLGYVWRTGEFGACSAGCGVGEESRTVICVDSAGAEVDGSLCTGPAPDATRGCDAGSPTCGLGEWSEFDGCDSMCTQTQTRSCDVQGHCAEATEQTRECSGGNCCPRAGDTCGPTTYRQSGGWTCRDDAADFNQLFYSNYIFVERRCNASRTCVPQDLLRSLECICSEAGPGCSSPSSGCEGEIAFARCRDASTGDRGDCPSTDVYAECF